MDRLTIENKMLERVSPLKLKVIIDQLTNNEILVLRLLDDFHYAFGSHIQRLLFIHGSPEAMTRARNRTLSKLTKDLLLFRYPRKPLPGNHHGSTEHIYTLAHAGQRIMNELRSFERPFRSIDRTTSHYEHALLVTELHVRMVESERSGRVELVKSQGEPASHRHYGSQNVLRPDGYLLFRTIRNEQHFEVAWFIEVEHSRQGETTTIAKLNAYRNYMEQLNSETQLMPKVLFIVLTDKHRAHLNKLIDRNAGVDRDVFSVVLFDNAIHTIITDTKYGDF